MSTNLEKILDRIQQDKDANVKPENIRFGTSVMDVQGLLKPIIVDGGDTATLIHLQKDDAPVQYEGIWLNTDKEYSDIFIEEDRYTNTYSYIYTKDPTDDTKNIIKDITIPVSFLGSTYVQRGNIVHMFGYYDRTASNNTSERINQHY